MPEAREQEIAYNQLYCAWTRPNGKRCRAYVRRGSRFCYWHDPETEQQRETGLRAARAAAPGPILPEAPVLETPEDVQAALRQVGVYLLTAERVEIGRAQAVAYVAGQLLRTIDVCRLRDELAAAQERARHLEDTLRYLRRDNDNLQQRLDTSLTTQRRLAGMLKEVRSEDSTELGA